MKYEVIEKLFMKDDYFNSLSRKHPQDRILSSTISNPGTLTLPPRGPAPFRMPGRALMRPIAVIARVT